MWSGVPCNVIFVNSQHKQWRSKVPRSFLELRENQAGDIKYSFIPYTLYNRLQSYLVICIITFHRKSSLYRCFTFYLAKTAKLVTARQGQREKRTRKTNVRKDQAGNKRERKSRHVPIDTFAFIVRLLFDSVCMPRNISTKCKLHLQKPIPRPSILISADFRPLFRLRRLLQPRGLAAYRSSWREEEGTLLVIARFAVERKPYKGSLVYFERLGVSAAFAATDKWHTPNLIQLKDHGARYFSFGWFS